MLPWTVEYGTLWAFDPADELPPACPAQPEVTFAEVGPGDIEALTAAMDLPTPEPIQERFQGNRRCFSLSIAGQIACYGWVTHGVECVGELERQFNLHPDEAYIWDCATVPAWRGQGCYSALLNQLIYRLAEEGLARLWIGASRQNQPSIQGMANAGFQQVIDLNYHRLYRLTLLWFQEAPTAPPPLVSAAYRILVDRHEHRFGRLAIGYKR